MTHARFFRTAIAAKELCVSISWLRAQKAKGVLTPGAHWIYNTGAPGGNVLWNVDAITEWQRRQTLKALGDSDFQAALIETYEEVGHVGQEVRS